MTGINPDRRGAGYAWLNLVCVSVMLAYAQEQTYMHYHPVVGVYADEPTLFLEAPKASVVGYNSFKPNSVIINSDEISHLLIKNHCTL